ncbi:hypothetical protein [Butyrivibrio sp. INlla14]|uniref:hypothetical protein n=1 Tax=Butyrivibrio sp. INlla14 TaxID=1520808 RepID=UPI0008760B57|nr:hypothetical protein [Butyrivibrio sp. INlla14]SCY40068.1 hypothetical protein SAMN02910371_02141 [Butyrivibrio sp. INlla14]
MLQLSYLGIAFAIVFYFVFGICVRLMALNDHTRNKARLAILITSFTIVTMSSLFAGLLNLNREKFILGVFFILISVTVFIILAAILIELHHIKTKVKMRRFMVLFDIVDRFINEGKTRDEILSYLVEIQKLTLKEARDFLDFISDPTNYKFLSDVNEKIHEAQILGRSK